MRAIVVGVVVDCRELYDDRGLCARFLPIFLPCRMQNGRVVHKRLLSEVKAE